MPLQLLHIRGIFPDTVDLFAIQSHHLSWVTPDLGARPTLSCDASRLTAWPPAGQSCRTGERWLIPRLAKPAKLIRRAVSGYSPRLIARVVSSSEANSLSRVNVVNRADLGRVASFCQGEKTSLRPIAP
jgi:hypothetical protein